MQGRITMLGLSVLLVATSAAAQGTQKAPATQARKKASTTQAKKAPATPPPEPQPAPVTRPAEPQPAPVVQAQPASVTQAQPVPAAPRPSRLQGVGNIDARLMLNTDILLAFAEVGVGADVGVLQLGPGVLALGGEFEVGACITPCLALNLVTGWSFSHMFYSPHARLTYHLLPSTSSGMDKVDLYGLALVGATLTTTRVANTGTGASAAFEAVGSDVGPSVGLGVGGKYFVQNDFFVGAEGRLRYSTGQYAYTVRVGNVSLSDTQSTWSLSGFHAQFFAGIRL